MRVLGLLVLGAALCGNAMALEASAGADTVNQSQVGINAKIDANTAILKSAISSVTNCGAKDKIYNFATNTCTTVVTSEADPVAMPKVNAITQCGDGNKFLRSNGTCSAAMPPDLSTQVNNIIKCNQAGKLWNGSACMAPASAGGTPVPNRSSCQDFAISTSKGTTVYCPANMVMVGATQYGIATGPKLWQARFMCCTLKMQ